MMIRRTEENTRIRLGVFADYVILTIELCPVKDFVLRVSKGVCVINDTCIINRTNRNSSFESSL
jgi:hypothetical protein